MQTNTFNFVKNAMRKKKRTINQKLAKCGIKTLEQVLHTNIISKDAKIKHIRHTYTCYEKHTKEFYRDNYGISLRNQLNEFISDLVDGVYTIADLKAYNKKLKEKLKTANDNFINDKRLLSPVQETIKLIEEPNTKEVKANTEQVIEYIRPPEFNGLTEEERYVLNKLPEKTLTSKMSVLEVKSHCIHWLKTVKTSWMGSYIDLAENHPWCVARFVVKLYLETRDTNICPDDFSDLDFMFWHEVKDIAYDWLIEKFDDLEAYQTFIETTIPDWIETEGCLQEDTLLDKLKKLKLEIDQSYILNIA